VWDTAADGAGPPRGPAGAAMLPQHPSGRTTGAGPGVVPAVHKTGAIGDRAFVGRCDRRDDPAPRRRAGFTAARVDRLGEHWLRAGFVTEDFRASADHAIMRQTGHRSPVMLEVYAREHAPLVGNGVTRIGL